MLDVCLLGTGGMMPLPNRWLTSLMLKYNGKNILIDCGEGTQIALKEKGWTFKPIETICFTHFHADHISGLAGMLLTMGNAQRTEQLTIVGPKGVEYVVNSLRVIAPELPFPIRFIELTQKTEMLDFDGYSIEAFKVNHNVVCYGYSFHIRRNGMFQVEKAMELDLPRMYWHKLQKGETISYDERIYTPEMVMGPERKGIKVTYCTDTRPVKIISECAKGADLFICEGMYGEKDKDDKAREFKHMTFYEAAALAKEANVEELWLTHYSPSLLRPEEYMDAVREIFPKAKAGKDLKSTVINFED
ncbi:ribonuclease Z [Parasporobacterium paucivorans]|uniref:Ribonuclease Z n=1 Tax=Parasporobacterium paucivorans DSM 15970 TaxID=1122934 RepID=A0A1M6KNP7_9FIRM|nr:ribonuclease Z [Parasporobacterium paucivorans]SHJ60512.1 RNAse Z [Parasporobacterium paucivorans DSM 15970]